MVVHLWQKRVCVKSIVRRQPQLAHTWRSWSAVRNGCWPGVEVQFNPNLWTGAYWRIKNSNWARRTPTLFVTSWPNGDLVSSRLTWVPIQCPQERHKWEWERRGWVRRRSWRWRSPQSLIRPYRLCECQIWKWTAHHMTFSSCLFTKVFFWSKSFWYLFTPKAAMGPVSKMTPANIDPTNEAEPEPAWRMIQTYIIYSAQRMIISQVWAETIHERNFQSLHI